MLYQPNGAGERSEKSLNIKQEASAVVFRRAFLNETLTFNNYYHA